MLNRPLIPIFIFEALGIVAGRLIFYESNKPVLIFLFLSAVCLFFSIHAEGNRKYAFLICGVFLLGIFLNPSHLQLDPFLKKLSNEQDTVLMEGTVLSQPANVKFGITLPLRVERILINEKNYIPETQSKVLLRIYKNTDEKIIPGIRLKVKVKLNSFSNFLNPGAFDYEKTMINQGFLCQATVDRKNEVEILGKGNLSFFENHLEKLKNPVRDLFSKTIADEQNRSIMNALILGERQEMSPEVKDILSKTGISHIVAVSGLHMGLVSFIVFYILKKLFSCMPFILRRMNVVKILAPLTFIVVLIYAALTGFQVSAQRALIMVGVYLFAVSIGRKQEVWSSLALAGILIISIDPDTLWSMSFHMSFLAVAGLLLFTIPMFNNLEKAIETIDISWCRWPLKRITELVCATVGANLILIPVLAANFHQISLSAIPVNIAVLPILGSIVLPAGLFAAFIVHISNKLAVMAVFLADLGTGIIIKTADFFYSMPFSFFWVTSLSIGGILCYYAAIFTAFYGKPGTRIKKMLVCIVLLITIESGLTLWAVRKTDMLTITFLDVGQGNSAVIKFPNGKIMLIDGGGFTGSDFDTGRSIIAPYLWYKRYKKIDYIALSHPQQDHMGGLAFIAEVFAPEQFWYNGDISPTLSYQKLMNIVNERAINILLPNDFAKPLKIGDAEISVIHPTEEYKSSVNSKDPNKNSLVIKISYGNASVMLPGDIERISEKNILSKYSSTELKSAVLLVPHHGSKTSLTEPFLKATDPVLSIISAGRDNRFGFPHKETLDKLKKHNNTILRTDIDGAITVYIGKNGKLSADRFKGENLYF